ncbi:10579_t:CDS:2 [Dentiscutata erythropus]|uniref:10579_t:CDS:1 n=1 Tax=Dentiscutata erythropus TaxID=1348616 RepID=A0A9N9I4R1_9GLOM|nr:10579_t:CDS:2 [Dentiscutata erythropus]
MSSSSVFPYNNEPCNEPYDKPYNESCDELFDESFEESYNELHNDDTTQELTNITCLDEFENDESLPLTKATITYKLFV